MQFTARHVPYQPGIDGAECQTPLISQLLRAFDVLQYPADLGSRKIGVDQQAGLGADGFSQAVGFQLIAKCGGATVLPDDSVIHSLAGFAIPDHGSFTLVGNADGGNRSAVQTDVGRGLGRNANLGRPDFLRVMLNPTRLRIDLAEFFLR